MALIACTECGREVSTSASACPGCGAPNKCALPIKEQQAQTLKPAADYEVFLLAIPVMAAMLIWFWVGNMNLLQSPNASLAMIGVATVLGTAMVAAMEAKALGMTHDKANGTTGPAGWFFVIVLMWIFAYPGYLYKRKQFGVANRLALGILVGSVFVVSWVVMNSRIDDKKAEIHESLEQVQHQLAPTRQDLQPPTPAAAEAFNTPNIEDIYTKVALDAVAKYEIVKRNGSAIDACGQASLVAASFLQAKDEENYKGWKIVEKADCKAAFGQ